MKRLVLSPTVSLPLRALMVPIALKDAGCWRASQVLYMGGR